MLNRFLAQPLALVVLAVSGLLFTAACSDDTSSGGGSGDAVGHGQPGGPVTGPADAHCGSTAQPTSAAACYADEGVGGGGEAPEHAPTLNNAEGDDADCKYHVTFTSTDVYADKDVTFTINLTNKVDGTPATGAATEIEAFLNDTHPAPNSDQKTTEDAPGVYTVGPVRLDAAGKWTVRFHFYDECSHLDEESPHSHVSFYVNVP